MRIVSALLPHAPLSLLLLVIWLLLNDSLAPGQILLGGVFAFLIPLFTKRFWPEPALFKRPVRALRLTGLVLYDIIVANFAVSRIVLGPTKAVKPAFVQVPLDLKADFSITLLASVISLTPGTLSADVNAERSHLLVHALSEEDPETLVRHIKVRYEAPIKEILEC